ncbi:MAG TPA: tRNA preQ1(34) S-adenosylmethionine ribosyltransferase-isomerase QueA [Candidatus Peribacteria bacterium]|nr:tRNA preQ1(34) S-adenosylmethionine ribosyltransferase-isomerase QueA [Candidatus Peribacteria bacterium]
MSPSFEEALRLYDYTLPPELIAQTPASPRDSAGLVVYDRATKQTTWTNFSAIGTFLPNNAVLVLNETKVIPAKMELTRSTGGRVSALAVGTTDVGVRVMANRKLKTGETLTLAEGMTFAVTGDEGRYWMLQPSFPVTELQRVLELAGSMPLPPYIKQTPLSRDEQRREYQSVFARNSGSIAAPTASLHFTDELLKSLNAQGIRTAFVTLHVHLGTFAPLTPEQWESGHLHVEYFSMTDETADLLNAAKKKGDPIVAVGTTSVRTLESASDEHGVLTQRNGTTDLFIREGYRFNFVDAMITNFHVPQSSLLMLVAAFTGRDAMLNLYKQAIEKQFRFFSFGDAMLIR